MEKSILDKINFFVENNIGDFHNARLKSIKKLKLKKLLKRKNPYLFKAKNLLTAQDIIKSLLDAHLSSQEETMFGNWLEGLAIYVNNLIYNGWKSGIHGIDLEFNKDNIRYIVNIKSGPNWGNSSQIKKMVEDFKTAKRTLRTSNSKLVIIAVNGCCYGKENKPDKGDYFKFCGQKFWEFISGDLELYTKIIKPLGYKAKEKNEEFLYSYAAIINSFTKEFTNEFCLENGSVDWNKLVKYNSAHSRPK